MKKFKILGVLSAMILVGGALFSLAGCSASGTVIDGAKFRGTKAAFHRKYDAENQVYNNLILRLTMSIAISEANKVMTIEQSKFEINQDYEKIELQDSYYQAKETIDVRGPRTENDEPSTSTYTTIIHMRIDFPDGLTSEELDAIRSSFKLTYDGHKISFTMIFVND